METNQERARRRMWSRAIKRCSTDGCDLILEFVNGTAYRYFDAAAHYDALVDSESWGKYFNAHVRNAYPAQCVARAVWARS